MRRISLEKAINILEACGYKKLDILEMDIYEFMDTVNKNIGTVESISIIDVMKKIYK